MYYDLFTSHVYKSECNIILKYMTSQKNNTSGTTI